MTIPPLRSFRLVCKPEQAGLVEALLAAQGFRFEEEPFFPLARRLLHEPLPLGSSLAAAFGCIYIQDRSSMLPPLALAPAPGSAVLDMCASPGSKTGLLGQLVGDQGFVLGNEPSKNRLATLRNNLRLLNLLCCATTSHPGEQIPLPGAGEHPDGEAVPCPGWSSIQLDPPCSGWGTAEKHPQALRLWQGDKVKPLIALQRRLLAEAMRLLRPGGLLAYSTCTTNVQENEEQVRYAREELGFVPRPAPPPPGFDFEQPALPDCSGVLRVPSGVDGQGFFVALLQKPETAALRQEPDRDLPATDAPEGGRPQEGLERGFFVRPWDKDSRYVGERRRHDRQNAPRQSNARPHLLPESALEGPYTDRSLLPDGDVAAYDSGIHFLPRARAGLIPERFAWKGFPLGRMGRGGEARVSPRLRALMPDGATARQRGLPLLSTDDCGLLLSLLNGQSLATDAAGPELGLYFRDLPLCRLAVKGRRALLPPW